MSGRVTLEDIAEASQTSVASVSLALRNKPGVSRARRERILGAARTLGYSRQTPSDTAEASTVKRVTILFRSLTTGPVAPLMDPFSSWVVTGIQEASQHAGLDLLLGSIPWDPDTDTVEAPPARYIDGTRDGLLLVGSYPESTLRQLFEMIGARGYPVVQVDGSEARPFMDCVGSRNAYGARTAAEYLIAQGHRRIAFAGRIYRHIPSFDERLRGYREVMAENGLEPWEVAVLGERATDPVIDPQRLPFTAVVAGNDYDATIVMRLRQAQGVSVPDDVSIVGFDDTDHASQAVPPLTTMRVDTLSMGRLAVEALSFRWKWPDAAPFMTTLTPQLVVRGSVRSLPG